MKTTATAAEIRKQFLVDDVTDATREITETISAQLDYDASMELLMTIIESIKPEDAQAGNQLDKLAWIARQSYIAGFVQSFKINAEALTQNYNDMFG